MPTDTKLQNLIINDLTEEQYKALTPNENELYLTPDTSGGESVSPTLYLFNSEDGGPRTTITEQEKTNLEKGLYNQVVYISEPSQNFMVYTPSKLTSIKGMYLFATIDGIVQKGEQVSCTTISFYSLNIGEKNTSGEYPITITKQLSLNIGSSITPSDLFQYLELNGGKIIYNQNTRYFPSIKLTDEQVATIKSKYENKEPLIIRVKYDDSVALPGNYIEFNVQNLTAGENSQDGIDNLYTSTVFHIPEPINFLIHIDIYSKSIDVYQKDFMYLDSSRVDINLNVQNALQLFYATGTWGPVSDYAIYFDTINGKPILHKDTTINNYDLGKSINLFGNHSILVPNASTDTEINLYNHDIEINFQYGQIQTSYHVYLNVVSSKNLNVNNITDLKILLGNTFRRSCTSGNDNEAPNEVIAISNNGFEFNNFSSILFSEVTHINITDTVTTI